MGLPFCLPLSEEAPDIAGFSSGSASISGTQKWSLGSNHSDLVPCPWHTNYYHCFPENSRSGRTSELGLKENSRKQTRRHRMPSQRRRKPGSGKPLGLLVNSGLALNSLRDAGIHDPLCWMCFKLQPHSDKRRPFSLYGSFGLCVVSQLKHHYYLPLF